MTDTILRVRGGSHAYGLNTATSDEDFIEVFMEPMARVLGPSGEGDPKSQHFGPNPAAANYGAQDTTRYPLRKYLHLAQQGNPTVLESMYSPVLYALAPGYELLNLAREGVFISEQMISRYRGYMRAQTLRLLGLKGGHSAGKANRKTDVSDRAGYDVKYAMHIIRLGYFAVELIETWRLNLPLDVSDPRHKFLMDIRGGGVPFDEFFDVALNLDKVLESYVQRETLPKNPNYAAVTEYSVRVHMRHYLDAMKVVGS